MKLFNILFSFKGRINRTEWWLAHLLMAVVSLIIYLISRAIGDPVEITLILSNIIFVGWIGLAIRIKRWQDRDKSGWWVLLELIPLIGGIWAFAELGFCRGTYGRNRFGPGPLQSYGRTGAS